MTTLADTPDAAPADEIPEPAEVDRRTVTRQGLALIARFVRLHPAPFVVSLAGGVGWAALVVAASYVLGRITDDVITPAFRGGIEASTAWWATFALFAVGALRGLSVVVRRWFGSLTEARMQVSLRGAAAERLLTMPLSAYRTRPTGQLLANADVDVLTATQMLMPLPFSLGVIALVVISLASLLTADVAFAVVALLLFPALAWLSRYYTDRVHEPSSRVQAQLGRVSSIAHESFDGALVVKTLGREEAERERFSAAAQELRGERLGVARLTALFQPMIAMLPNLGVVVLLMVGAWRVDQGAATEGELVQAVALFGWLAFPMRIVGFLFESIPRAVVSIARVDDLLAIGTDPAAEGVGEDHPDHLPDGPVGLELRGVSFAYGDAPVLSDVTFSVEPGEVVALVGTTGAGKSTLVNMLVRLDEPTAGTVLVGGVPVERVDPAELREAVSVAFQESYLFATSVEENVRLGRDVTAAAMEDALDRARARRFVDALPQGRATVVGERGVTLSGGQRQRVALARALAGRPRVLVLDDATSAVDPVVEAEILAGLRTGDTTLLIVAHRRSTILLADRVVHLEGGKVRAVGTHEELLADPDYAALVTAYEAEELAERDTSYEDAGRDVAGGPR